MKGIQHDVCEFCSMSYQFESGVLKQENAQNLQDSEEPWRLELKNPNMCYVV